MTLLHDFMNQAMQESPDLAQIAMAVFSDLEGPSDRLHYYYGYRVGSILGVCGRWKPTFTSTSCYMCEFLERRSKLRLVLPVSILILTIPKWYWLLGLAILTCQLPLSSAMRRDKISRLIDVPAAMIESYKSAALW